MAKKVTKTYTKAAATDEHVSAPLEATIVGTEVIISDAIDGQAGAAGESVPAATNTPESESGAAAGEVSAAPVKPQEDADQTGAMVAEAVTGTPMPEAETAASGTNSEPSQGAADDDGSMAGSVNALVIEAGAASVAELLGFADLGKRVLKAFSENGFDALEWIKAYENGPPAWLGGVDLAKGPDASFTSVITVDEDGKIASHIAVKDDESMAAAIEALRVRYPGTAERGGLDSGLLSGNVTATIEAPRNTGTIRVKSTRDGFRRAGLSLSKEGCDFLPGELTEDQLKAFDGDPAVTVEYV